MGGEIFIMETLIVILFFVLPIIVFYSRSEDSIIYYARIRYGEEKAKYIIEYLKERESDIDKLRGWMLVIGLCPVLFNLAEVLNAISVAEFTTAKLYFVTAVVLWTLNSVVTALEEMEVRSR